LSSVSPDYDSYLYLRRMCLVLGHDSKCLGDGSQGDLVMKGVMLRHLLSEPVVSVRPGLAARTVLAISREINLVSHGASRVSHVPGSPVVMGYGHTQGMLSLVPEGEICEYVSGKRVALAGVLPSELGATPVQSVSDLKGTHLRGQYDVIFARSLDAAKVSLVANTLFVPDPGNDIFLLFWHRTGRQWKKYCEFVWVGTGAMPFIFCLPTSPVPGYPVRSPRDGGLAIYTAPVPEKWRFRVPNLVTGAFHFARTPTRFRSIKSDLPLAHAYESEDYSEVQRGLRGKQVVLRKYEQAYGYWWGQEVSSFNTSDTILLWERASGKALWDFPDPANWKYVVPFVIVPPDDDGKEWRWFSTPGRRWPVPSSWTQLEVSEAVGHPCVDSCGTWVVPPASRLNLSSSDVWDYFLVNGVWAHFTKVGTSFRGIHPQTQEWWDDCQSEGEFRTKVRARFKLTNGKLSYKT